jgi:hypothetical protein
MNIQDMIRRQEEEKERKYGLLPPNFVMFTFYKDKVNEIDRFSRILKEFLSTIGITASMVNSDDRQLIATIPRGTTFDKNIILDNFKDIIEFLSLWAYLRQESLIIDVPKDVTVDDLGILFELKPKEPKQEIPFIIHKDKNSKSSVNPITRTLVCVTEFYDSPPNYLISSYMDEEWVLNNEYLKNCERSNLNCAGRD